jgi:hypothetical protein
MAESFAHRWGQIIGNIFQESLKSGLQKVAAEHRLYLDFQRERPARTGKKVTWADRNGNAHDLDYVLERGGTEDVRGLPAAFIETAWRRYTKHSRNKAQEIQGAVLALAETYSHLRPFLGIVLAGVFTKGSLEQLRTCGFSVAYVPYNTIVAAFAVCGIDAAFDEETDEADFREKVRRYDALRPADLERLKANLLNPPDAGAGGDELPLSGFLAALAASLSRGVVGVTVAVLHGAPQQLTTVDAAIDYLQRYDENRPSPAPALKYEVDVRYNNGDVVHGIFQEKAEAIRFLRTFA